MIGKLVVQYGLYEALAKGLNIGLTLVLAALLTPQLFGAIALVISLEQFLIELINFGQVTVVLRNFRRSEGRRGALLAPSWTIMAAISALLFVGAAILFGAGIHLEQLEQFSAASFLVFLLSCLSQSSVNLYLAYTRGKEDVATYGRIRTWFQVSKFILCVALFKIVPGVNAYILGGILSSLAAVGVIYARDGLPTGTRGLRNHALPKVTKENFWMGLPLAFSGVLGLVYSVLGRFVIDRYLDKTAVAIYSFAQTQGSAIFFVMNILAIAYLPKIFSTEDYSDGASLHLRRFTVLAFSATVLASLAAYFLVFPLSLRFVRPDYAQGHTALALVCVSVMFTALRYHGTYLLMFLRKVSVLPFVTVATLGLNFFLNLRLIPNHGINGVAMSSVLSEAAAFVLLTLVSQYLLRAQTRGKRA